MGSVMRILSLFWTSTITSTSRLFKLGSSQSAHRAGVQRVAQGVARSASPGKTAYPFKSRARRFSGGRQKLQKVAQASSLQNGGPYDSNAISRGHRLCRPSLRTGLGDLVKIADPRAPLCCALGHSLRARCRSSGLWRSRSIKGISRVKPLAIIVRHLVFLREK